MPDVVTAANDFSRRSAEVPRDLVMAAGPKQRDRMLDEGWVTRDLAALAQSNSFLVFPADKEELPAGEFVHVLLRKDVI